MMYINRKLRSRSGGINRTVAILLALVCVMLVVIAIPAWKVFRYRSERTACIQAMKSAGDGLIIDYLGNFEEGSLEDAMATLDEVLPARPKICPSGGDVYLVRGEDGIFAPVCGLHDGDTKLRVRLNASRAMNLLEEALRKARIDRQTEPESVEITLNNKPLECVRVQELQPIRWGTKNTNGYKGIVCFYGINGDGGFSSTTAEDGDILYFVYADENHAAIWRADDGWTGDAYQVDGD